MKKLLMLVLGAVLAIATPFAHADPLNQISFAGSVSYAAATPPATGTQVTFDTPPTYPTGGNASVFGNSTGIFSAFTGPTATSFGSKVIFNSFNTGQTNFALFTATAPNGQTVTFTVTSVTSTTAANGTVSVAGNGYYTFVSADGKTTTTVPSGTFDMTSQGGGMGVSFSDTNAVTPEPSSLVLLGTGLVSAAGMLVRRRRKLIA